MSQSGSQAAAFFREVARHGIVWSVSDDQGSPAPKTSSGERAVPFWSSQTRAQRAADIWSGSLRTGSVSVHTLLTRFVPFVPHDPMLPAKVATILADAEAVLPRAVEVLAKLEQQPVPK